MKHFRWALLAVVCLSFAVFAPAQSVDAFFGFNTLVTKTGTVLDPTSGTPFGIKMGGGLYFNAGGDLIFLPHGLGIGAQVTWRAKANNYAGTYARPILYDFNLVWEPVPTGREIRPDFAIGIGADSLRAYQGFYQCGTFTGCTDYVSSNHFVLHASAGVKIYATEHIFLRPAVDYYHIRHNTEFGGIPTAWQLGISIGYTLGPSSN